MRAVKDRQGPHGGRRGFTLVELLTIIAILGLLIAMLAPAVHQITKSFKVSQTQAYISQIGAGVGQFINDHEQAPPSDGSYPHIGSGTKKTSPATGAAGLVQCLMGYKDYNDDGLKGLGFRKLRAGKKYGPYVSQNLPLTEDSDDPRFLDAFGNEILYYRWKAGGSGAGGNFDGGDNTGGPADIMGYVANHGPDRNDRPVYRKDYLILSPGPDREWAKGLSSDTRKVDDLANFSFYVDNE